MKINELDISNYEYIQEKYQLSTLCAKILASKNFSDSEIEELIYTEYSLLSLDLSFMEPIVDRIQLAKYNNEKIMICGDYDCDGICATTILYDTLKRMDIDVGYYIPNRFIDGYGVNVNTIKLAHEKGYSLIITVDNGVGATQALSYAKELGMDIILSDHHNYDEDNLVYDYFVHPNVLAKPYQGMCGAGIALLFSLACIGYIENHVILAGIATIGDIVPLKHINRSLVKESIKLLNENKFLAIQCLENDKKQWNETKIAFQIVPKINSVGRLANIANVNQLPKFLLSENINVVNDFVVKLNQVNETRKEISGNMSNKASMQIQDEPFLILYDESFHEGINGIVASKFNNELQKPVMCLSANDGLLKGSIRSNTIDLRTFFKDCSCLVSYGGHKEAAGISFAIEDLNTVKSYIQEHMIEQEEVIIDCIHTTINNLSVEEVESLTQLAPFGCGFELPLIAITDRVQKKIALSKGKHMKYVTSTIEFLKFNCENTLQEVNEQDIVTFVGKLSINEFNHKKTVNMIVDYMYR